MSLSKSATPLRVKLHPSRIAASMLTVVHTIAIVLVSILPVAVLLKLTIIVLVLVSLWRTLNQVLLKQRTAVHQFVWGVDGDWTLIASDGQAKKAKLLPSSYVQSWMTVLNFDVGQRFRPYSVVLLPDVIDPEIFRRLRVRLTLVKYSLLE